MNNNPDKNSVGCGCLFFLACGTLLGLFSIFFHALSLFL